MICVAGRPDAARDESMNLKEAVAVAKQQVIDLSPDAPQDVRLEQFLYDDHLGI